MNKDTLDCIESSTCTVLQYLLYVVLTGSKSSFYSGQFRTDIIRKGLTAKGLPQQ